MIRQLPRRAGWDARSEAILSVRSNAS